MRFAWLDIEDHADAIGDLDIETFPTLLIAISGRLQFFGPLTSHAGVLTRLIQASLATQPAQAMDAQLAESVAKDDAMRIWQKLQSNPAWLESLEIQSTGVG